MKNNLTLGMPHLLSNFKLNLNHISKIFGDNHWHYMLDKPSDQHINGNRIYQSFLRIDFSINDVFKEDDTFQVNITGKYIDDYIFKTEHTFGKNIVSMYTIGIYVDNGKIQKATSHGKKCDYFWNSHKENKNKTINLKDAIDFPTYYNIDFNCAKILYCANYLKFVYQYCDVMEIDPIIKRIDFFGNIKPKAILKVAKDNDDLVILENDRLIARVLCDY
jgi:outer membrane protein assembly factor BamE (lipoprotein component of BamABCDE complex)